jgi:polyisoprenoid-binding protein YceI
MAKTIWAIDPTHSEVHFKIKHLVISTVTGAFKSFSGKATSASGEFENAKVNFSIDVDSIDTNQPQRDGHLKSADFFETDKYPTIDFESTSFTKVKGDDYKLSGKLTMHGVTKPVELDVEYGGSEKDGYGNVKHGFEVSGKINRKEFGLTYNSITEAGGLALGEDIKLLANIQVAQLEAVPA